MSDDECYEEYDKWLDENDDELWAAYHEQGANYDQNYEDWCEKQYEEIHNGQKKLRSKIKRTVVKATTRSRHARPTRHAQI